jgi:hypothetical protein
MHLLPYQLFNLIIMGSATAALDGAICTWQVVVGGRSSICPTESSLCFSGMQWILPLDTVVVDLSYFFVDHRDIAYVGCKSICSCCSWIQFCFLCGAILSLCVSGTHNSNTAAFAIISKEGIAKAVRKMNVPPRL